MAFYIIPALEGANRNFWNLEKKTLLRAEGTSNFLSRSLPLISDMGEILENPFEGSA